MDKAHAKTLVAAMDIEGLKIPRTYALYDKKSIGQLTVAKLRQIPQPYIIKATHMSGEVSRVKDGRLTCVKGCDLSSSVPIGKKALAKVRKRSLRGLATDFTLLYNETQYALRTDTLPNGRGLHPQIIIEEDIQVDDVTADVSFWYAAAGRPLFVSVQCSPTGAGDLGTTKERAIFSTDFRRLNMSLMRPPCPGQKVKPRNWAKQVEVATALAAGAPGPVRIDLYASERDIYFSEYTYTTSFCKPSAGFRPRVADGLIHAVQRGAIDPARATPELVRSIIHDTSWVYLTLVRDRMVHPEASRAFPSPVDLCEHVANDHAAYEQRNWQGDATVTRCLAATKEAATAELRCVVGPDDDLTVLTDDKRPTLAAVMAHVDWGRSLALLFAVVATTLTNAGTARRANQYVNNVLYLVVMVLVVRLTQSGVLGTFYHSPIDVARQSFAAFAYVHPMASPGIALCHFATYWFLIAAWRSKSPRNLLMWQLLYETVTAGVNEFAHLVENQDVVHCTRVAFKESAKRYAFDDLIRAYIVPPFFVYGYLLPKFIWFWAREPALWVGMIVLLTGVYKLKDFLIRERFFVATHKNIKI